MDLSSIFNLPPPPHPNAAEQPFIPSIASVPADVAPSLPPPPATAIPQPNNSPPYAEMIFAAIKALNEGEGSSKQAISRYINAAFPDLPPTHSALLDKAIINLKKTGHLDLVKKSYKIPGSKPAAPSVPLPESNPGTSGKRSRGRPKKQQLPNFDGGEAVGAAVPPVVSAADATHVSLGLVEEPVPEETDSLPRKRGRGRPKKNALVNGLTVAKPADAGSGKRGRPKKSGTAMAMENGTVDVAVEGEKRGRGRPKRIAEGNGDVVANVQGYVLNKRGRGRPRLKSTEGAVIGYVGRKRGRPKKAESGGGDGGGVVIAGKKRGRPPGRNSSGRPVGRPRKNPQAGSSVTPILGSFTEEDVLRKFKFLQMKIKVALVKLRPQCTGSISAVDAIQELEGFAAMDFTAVPLVSEAAPVSAEPPAVAPAN